MIMEAGKSEICSLGQQALNSELLMAQFQVCWRIFSCCRRPVFFSLFKPSADWMRPAYIMEGNLIYPVFANLNVNCIETPSRLTQEIHHQSQQGWLSRKVGYRGGKSKDGIFQHICLYPSLHLAMMLVKE